MFITCIQTTGNVKKHHMTLTHSDAYLPIICCGVLKFRQQNNLEQKVPNTQQH